MSRKNLTREVNNGVVNDLLNANPIFNCECNCSIQGVLNDEYLFINYDYKKNIGIILGRKHRVRHYIIIREKYLNEWSSTLVATETDSEKAALEFMNESDKQEEEFEKEEAGCC